MGSTGRGLYKSSRTGNVNTETFNIPGAVNYKGKVPENSGLEKVGNNKITLKVNSLGRQDIIFQFKLRKDNRLSITAYDPNTNTRSTVDVSSTAPDLDRVIRTGSRSASRAALVVKTLMARSSNIDQSQLGAIANKLLRNKRKR